VFAAGWDLLLVYLHAAPEENQAVASAFLSEHREFRLVPKAELSLRLAPVLNEQGYLRCLPQRDDADGFFAARIERER
jgi:16S rRNA (cytosine967-C5)-methyltransferase